MHFNFFDDVSFLNARVLINRHLGVDVEWSDKIYDITYYEWEAGKIRDAKAQNEQNVLRK